MIPTQSTPTDTTPVTFLLRDEKVILNDDTVTIKTTTSAVWLSEFDLLILRHERVSFPRNSGRKLPAFCDEIPVDHSVHVPFTAPHIKAVRLALAAADAWEARVRTVIESAKAAEEAEKAKERAEAAEEAHEDEKGPKNPLAAT